jgi:hypothetical protein
MRLSSHERVSEANSLVKSYLRVNSVVGLRILRTSGLAHVFKAIKHGIYIMQPPKGGAHVIWRDEKPGKEKQHCTGETSVSEALGGVSSQQVPSMFG